MLLRWSALFLGGLVVTLSLKAAAAPSRREAACDFAWSIVARHAGYSVTPDGRVTFGNGHSFRIDELKRAVCERQIEDVSVATTIHSYEDGGALGASSLSQTDLWNDIGRIARYVFTWFGYGEALASLPAVNTPESLLLPGYGFVVRLQAKDQYGGSGVAIHQATCGNETLLVVLATRHQFIDEKTQDPLFLRDLKVNDRSPASGYVLLRNGEQAIAYLWFEGATPVAAGTIDPWYVHEEKAELFPSAPATLHGFPQYLNGKKLSILNLSVGPAEDGARLKVVPNDGTLDVPLRSEDRQQPNHLDFRGMSGGALVSFTAGSREQPRLVGVIETVFNQNFYSSVLQPVEVGFGWRELIMLGAPRECGKAHTTELELTGQEVCLDADGDGFGNPAKCWRQSKRFTTLHAVPNRSDCHDGLRLLYPRSDQTNYAVGYGWEAEGGCACDRDYPVEVAYNAQLAVRRKSEAAGSPNAMWQSPVKPGELIVTIDSTARGWLKVESDQGEPLWLACDGAVNDPRGNCLEQHNTHRSYRLPATESRRHVSFWVDPTTTSSEPSADSLPPSHAVAVACRSFEAR